MKHDLAHVIAYLDAHAETTPEKPWNPVVTISREKGAGGSIIAHKVGSLLTQQGDKRPWLVIDRSLAKQVVEHQHLPKRIEQFLGEKKISYLTDFLEELLGLHPSTWTLVEHMTQTILQLAHIGHVVFVGRAANIITTGLPDTYHIRLTGSLEKRIARMMEFQNLSYLAAKEDILRADQDRAKFTSRYFHHRIDDPRGYHLMINTDWVPFDVAAKVVADLVLSNGILGMENIKPSQTPKQELVPCAG